jgi:hypothetical protein
MAERPSLLNGGKGPSTVQNLCADQNPLKFTVKDREPCSQPQSTGKWNNKCANPLGPK